MQHVASAATLASPCRALPFDCVAKMGPGAEEMPSVSVSISINSAKYYVSLLAGSLTLSILVEVQVIYNEMLGV